MVDDAYVDAAVDDALRQTGDSSAPTNKAALHRFWITLVDAEQGSRLGYGVTAYDVDDARQILAYLAFDGLLPEVANIIVDVNVNDLDQGHVIPNMNPPNWRGIWFPKGFDPQLR